MIKKIELKTQEISNLVDELETVIKEKRISSSLAILTATGISFLIANYAEEIQKEVVPMNLIIELLKVSQQIEDIINEQGSDDE